MENIESYDLLNSDFNESMVLDISDLDVSSKLESIISLLLPHLGILLIILILFFFITFKKDKTTFKIGGLYLLFYVIFNDVIFIFTSDFYHQLISNIIQYFNIGLNYIIHYTSIFASIEMIIVNLLLLLPIKSYLLYKNFNINYKKIFLLFLIYYIVSTFYYLLNEQFNYGGFSGEAEHYQFTNIGIYLLWINLPPLLSAIISYKIAFYQKSK